jgi:hypothetical protein
MDIKRKNNSELCADLATDQKSSFDPVRHRSDELKNGATSSPRAKEIVLAQISQREGSRTGFLFDYDGTMSHPEKRRALVDDFEEIAMLVREKGHEQSFNTGRPYNEMAQVYENSGVSGSFLEGQQDFYEYGSTFRSHETGGKEKIVEGLEFYEPIVKDIQKDIKGDIQTAIAAARQNDLQKRLETIPEEAIDLLKEINEKYPGSLDTIKVSSKTMGLTMHCKGFSDVIKSKEPTINDEEKQKIIDDLIYKPLALLASNCLAKKPKYNAFRLADPKYTGIDIVLKQDLNIKGGPPSKRTATEKFLRDGKFTHAIYFGDDKPDLEMQAEGESHLQFNSIDEKAIEKKLEFGETVAAKARGKLELSPVGEEVKPSKLSPEQLKQARLARLIRYIGKNQTKLRYQAFVAVKHANTPQEVLEKADIVVEGQNQARDLFRNLVMDSRFLPWDGK